MLSPEEKQVLVLLEQLGSSALNVQDQKKPVAEILENIQRLEDAVIEQEVLGGEASRTFVILARRRLVEAQQMSLDNFGLLRQQKVAKLNEKPPLSGNTDKEKLFGNRSVPGDLQQSIYESKTESMTKILHRMHELAQEEVLKGELNIMELDTSSKTLTELQNKYSAIDVLLNGSKRLVKLLDEADKWDRWCMLASLGFLAFAFAYVLYRRVLHGPLKLLLWFSFKLIGISRFVSSLAPERINSPMAVDAPSTSAFTPEASCVESPLSVVAESLNNEERFTVLPVSTYDTNILVAGSTTTEAIAEEVETPTTGAADGAIIEAPPDDAITDATAVAEGNINIESFTETFTIDSTDQTVETDLYTAETATDVIEHLDL